MELKILRIRARLTQHEAGKIVDLPAYEVSRIETGRGVAREDKIVRLRNRLKELAEGRT